MGGPSTAIVVEELIVLGARRLVRVGTCGALVGARARLAADRRDRAGARRREPRASAPSAPLAADPALLAALHAAGNGATTGIVRSGDLYYGADASAGDAVAVDLTAGAVFAVAARHGVAAACVLSVSDVLVGERRRIEPEALEHAEVELGRVGAAALS